MDRPASPTPFGDENEQAVNLLGRSLARHKVDPSEWLVLLFGEAARQRVAATPHLITTESMLLAIVAIARSPPTAPDDVEGRLLIRAGQSLQRDRDLFAKVFSEFERTDDGGRETPLGALEFSDNVERVVAEAALRAGARGSNRRVGIDDFLTVFPPAGSRAARLLAQLGFKSLLAPADISSPQKAAQEPSREKEIPPPPEVEADRGEGEAPKRIKSAAPARKPSPRREINERVFTHPDEPAIDDRLGRKPFAEVLAGRIREARASGGNDGPCAFVAHLHGPWGSGKSSVLNFLERELCQDEEPWLVVRFDAWRNQRLQPPWWSLITTIYATARHSLNWRKALRLKIRWLIWRIRADYVPLIAVVACAAALLFLLFWVGPPGASTPTPGAHEEQFANWLDKILKLAAGAITIIGAIVLWSRSLAMGSQRAAQAYADLKTDPYGPIARLFDRLIDAIDQPVVVFVDDLDRCESKYVVDLLEGIQTLMRGAAVTYVVAGDRKWICSSFEQRYGAFSPPIGEPGRPLGYLFLDKIFQISAAIPQPGAEAQLTYWNGLLDPSALPPERRREKLVEAQAKADADAAQLNRQEDLQTMVSDAELTRDSATIQATRAAAAKRIASQPAAAEAEHRLRRYVNLLEPNPRAMKRLVNAYGMHQAALFLAGRTCPPDALARWTILELRWPLLADFLANRPDCAGHLYAPLADDALPHVPDSLRDLFGDDLVTAVIGPKRSPGRLSATAIRSILGASQGER